LFFLIIPHPPRSTLFPYTTLFRSIHESDHHCTFLWAALFLSASWILKARKAPGRSSAPAARISPVSPSTSNGQGRPCCIFAKSRSEEHTSELQSRFDLVCRLLLEK